MKFRVSMKDPDALFESVRDAVAQDLADSGHDKEEVELLTEHRRDKLTSFASRWMKYGEYLTVEFDTDAQTATVVEAK